jgi:hypothetical protein
MAADNFTLLKNSHVRDVALTWESRGLLAWLSSHADGFKVTMDTITEAGPAGRRAVRSMVQELEQAGYLRRERMAVVTGGSTVDYVLTDPRECRESTLGNDAQEHPRPDQQEQDVSAGQPRVPQGHPRSFVEEQEKTKKASPSLRATRLPENFQPNETMREWFKANKLGEVIDGIIEHEKFCDYFAGAPGEKGRKVDWPATWRNWMRSAAERRAARPWKPGQLAVPVSGAPYRPSTTDQKVAQTLELGRRLQEMEDGK